MESLQPADGVLPPELDPRGRGPGMRCRGGRGRGTGHPGLRRLGRALSWVAVVTSMVVLLGSGGVYVYINKQLSNVRRTGALCLAGCTGSPTELGSTENFLLVGSDTRSGANSTGANAGLAQQGAGVGDTYGNSDTTLLVHLSADRSKVTVISFPRDLLVTVPTYRSKTGQQLGGQQEKFNYAHSADGPALLVRQVEALSGLPVDHYVEIDFAGFENMVNALGGVEICLSQDAIDPGIPGVTGGSGFHGTKGVHSIDGLTALAYVRQRDGLPRGDLDRIQRQQRFLASIVRKVKSAGTLLNPFKLNSFLTAVTQAVTLDPGTGATDLLALAAKLRNLDPSRVSFYTVPIAGNGGGPNDPLGEYLNIDTAGAHAIFQAVHDDRDPAAPPRAHPTSGPRGAAGTASTTPGPATTTGPPLVVPSSQVTVTVSNGSGIAGQGAAVTATLTALGYPATLGPDTQRVTPTGTEIRYGSNRVESGQTLAAAMPGAVLVPEPSDDPQALTLIVGTDYTPAHAVTVGTPTATALGTPPTLTASTPSTSLPGTAPTPTARPHANFNAQNGNCGP